MSRDVYSLMSYAVDEVDRIIDLASPGITPKEEAFLRLALKAFILEAMTETSHTTLDNLQEMMENQHAPAGFGPSDRLH